MLACFGRAKAPVEGAGTSNEAHGSSRMPESSTGGALVEASLRAAAACPDRDDKTVAQLQAELARMEAQNAALKSQLLDLQQQKQRGGESQEWTAQVQSKCNMQKQTNEDYMYTCGRQQQPRQPCPPSGNDGSMSSPGIAGHIPGSSGSTPRGFWRASSLSLRQASTHSGAMSTAAAATPSATNILKACSIDTTCQSEYIDNTLGHDKQSVSDIDNDSNLGSFPVITLARLQAAAAETPTPYALLVFGHDETKQDQADAVQTMDIPDALLPAQGSQRSNTPDINRQGDLPMPETASVHVHCLWLNTACHAWAAILSGSTSAEAVDHYITMNVVSNRMVEGFCRNLVQSAPRPVHWYDSHAPAGQDAAGLMQLNLWPCRLLHCQTGGEQPHILSAALLAVDLLGPEPCQLPPHIPELLVHHAAASTAPCMVTLVDTKGRIQLQNPESCARIGCHAEHTMTHAGNCQQAKRGSVCHSSINNYLAELFSAQEGQLAHIEACMASQQMFEGRVSIVSSLLRQWAGLDPDEELWYHVQVTQLLHPLTGVPLYCITQVEISEVVEAEMQVANLQYEQTALLQEILPAQVIDHLLNRQDTNTAAMQHQTSNNGYVPAWPAAQHEHDIAQQRARGIALPANGTHGLVSPTATHRSGSDTESILSGIVGSSHPARKPTPAAELDCTLSVPELDEIYVKTLDSVRISQVQKSGMSGTLPGYIATEPDLPIRASIPGGSDHNTIDTNAKQPLPPFKQPGIDRAGSLSHAHGTQSERGSHVPPYASGHDCLDSCNSVPRLAAPSVMATRSSLLQSGDHGYLTTVSPASLSMLMSAVFPQTWQLQGRTSARAPAVRTVKQSSWSASRRNSKGIVVSRRASGAEHSPVHASLHQHGAVPGVIGGISDRAAQDQVGTLLTSMQQPPSLLQRRGTGLPRNAPAAQGNCRVWLTQQDVMSLATFHPEATILFADIKGFTSLSEQLHPSQVMLFLNSLYSVWDSLLGTFGIYKVETIGDSYMAATGLFCPDPVTGVQRLGGTDPDHVPKMIRFAQAMLLSSQSIETPLGQPVQVRIGIHTGSCSSGVVGQRMPRFCLFGDSVNTSSRMESHGVPGCLHVSDATYQLCSHLPWQPMGGILVKGKGLMQTWVLPVIPLGHAALKDLQVTNPRLDLSPPLVALVNNQPLAIADKLEDGYAQSALQGLQQAPREQLVVNATANIQVSNPSIRSNPDPCQTTQGSAAGKQLDKECPYNRPAQVGAQSIGDVVSLANLIQPTATSTATATGNVPRSKTAPGAEATFEQSSGHAFPMRFSRHNTGSLAMLAEESTSMFPLDKYRTSSAAQLPGNTRPSNCGSASASLSMWYGDEATDTLPCQELPLPASVNNLRSFTNNNGTNIMIRSRRRVPRDASVLTMFKRACSSVDALGGRSPRSKHFEQQADGREARMTEPGLLNKTTNSLEMNPKGSSDDGSVELLNIVTGGYPTMTSAEKGSDSSPMNTSNDSGKLLLQVVPVLGGGSITNLDVDSASYVAYGKAPNMPLAPQPPVPISNINTSRQKQTDDGNVAGDSRKAKSSSGKPSRMQVGNELGLSQQFLDDGPCDDYRTMTAPQQTYIPTGSPPTESPGVSPSMVHTSLDASDTNLIQSVTSNVLRQLAEPKRGTINDRGGREHTSRRTNVLVSDSNAIISSSIGRRASNTNMQIQVSGSVINTKKRNGIKTSLDLPSAPNGFHAAAERHLSGTNAIRSGTNAIRPRHAAWWADSAGRPRLSNEYTYTGSLEGGVASASLLEDIQSEDNITRMQQTWPKTLAKPNSHATRMMPANPDQ